MIQRIQTIWLLLAALCAFLGLKFAFYSGSFVEGLNAATFKELNGLSTIPLVIATVAVGLLAIINIFLFKNRTIQLRLCIAGILLEALVIFLYYTEIKKFTTGNLSIASLLQALIVLFFFLAGRGISNDNKIIKESSRLR